MDKRFENGKKKLLASIDSGSPEHLYTEHSLNYRGEGSLYMDEIAGILVERFSSLVAIPEKPRPEDMTYRRGHCGQTDAKKPDQFSERHLGRAFYNHCVHDFNDPKACLGKIIDYEVPLKPEQNDKSGKIDLLCIDTTFSGIRLIELKIRRTRSDDTLLRAVMEIFTYYKLLGKERFFSDYKLKKCPFQLVVLSEEDSLSQKQMKKLVNLPNLSALIRMMAENVGSPFVLASFKLAQTEIPRAKDTIVPDEKKKPFLHPRFLPIRICKILEIGAS